MNVVSEDGLAPYGENQIPLQQTGIAMFIRVHVGAETVTK